MVSVRAKHLKEVYNWYGTRGIKLELGEHPCIDLLNKKVVLDGMLDNQQLLFAALHEAGHFIVNDKPDWCDKYPVRQEVRDELTDSEDLFSSVELLHEEYEAWEEGRKLGIELGIGNLGLDDAWIERKANALMSYITFISGQVHKQAEKVNVEEN
jgi:hypothetical protein